MLSNFFNFTLQEVFGFVVGNGLPADIFSVGEVFIGYAAAKVALWVMCYFFLGFGLYTMAKRRDMKMAICAFIPFARVYLMGKLVGEINFFGVRIKRIGLIALIAEIATFLLAVVLDAMHLPLLFDVWNDVFNEAAYEYFMQSFGQIQFNAMAISLVHMFANFINEVVGFIMLLFLFRNYAPKSSFVFAILSVFLEFMGPILVFVIRKNSCEEYREYMKMKMHSMYGGGNPYQYSDGTYRDPYDLSKEGDKRQEKPESPFGEYDDKK